MRIMKSFRFSFKLNENYMERAHWRSNISKSNHIKRYFLSNFAWVYIWAAWLACLNDWWMVRLRNMWLDSQVGNRQAIYIWMLFVISYSSSMCRFEWVSIRINNSGWSDLICRSSTFSSSLRRPLRRNRAETAKQFSLQFWNDSQMEIVVVVSAW